MASMTVCGVTMRGSLTDMAGSTQAARQWVQFGRLKRNLRGCKRREYQGIEIKIVIRNCEIN